MPPLTTTPSTTIPSTTTPFSTKANSPAACNLETVGLIFLSTISTTVKRLVSLGLEPERLLRGTGLTEQQLDASTSSSELVSGALLLAVYNNARRTSADRALGLRYGETADVTIYGPLGFAMLSAATDIEAVNLALKYQRIHFGNLAHLSLLVEDGNGVIRINENLPDGYSRQFFIEMLLSGFLRFNMVLAGKPTRLNELRLAYADPGYVDYYQRLFNCSIQFDAKYHEIVFDTGILAIELPNADRMTYLACEKICADLLEQFNKGEAVSHRVRRLMLERFEEFPDMKSLASYLQCDERTLRRKLSAEGTSFQSIKDSVRCDTAINYLRSTSLSVREIAQRIGFDEPSNFRRAFRRWTGNQPSHYRV